MKTPLMAFASFIFLWISFINGCRKSDVGTLPAWPRQPSIIMNSFTEEFDTLSKLSYDGWAFKNNFSSINEGWQTEYMKFQPVILGWNAYSYKSFVGENAYAGHSSTTEPVISMWMFTPPVAIRNGDRISFYTVDDTIPGSINRMQVRLNPLDTTSYGGPGITDEGKFTIMIADINSSQLADGYPQKWIKMEYTITGLPGTIQSRIGFRYFISSPDVKKPGAIGLDVLHFEKS